MGAQVEGSEGKSDNFDTDPINLVNSGVRGKSTENPYNHVVSQNMELDRTRDGKEREMTNLQDITTSFLVNPCFEDNTEDYDLFKLKKRKCEINLHGSSSLHATMFTSSLEDSLDDES